MSRKYSLLVIALLISIAGSYLRISWAAGQDTDPITIAFVSGVKDDPFYITLQSGIVQAISDLNTEIELVVENPDRFDADMQTSIIENLIDRGNIDYLLIAPTDMQEMIPVLQKAYEAGIAILTVDTFIGKGDYATGVVTFPLTYIGSDNFEGGFMACKSLAENLQEGANIYIQHAGSGISTVDQREAGCQAAAYAYGLQVVGVDYNSDNADIARQQTTAALEGYPNLAGIFGTNFFGAEGAGLAVQEAGLKGRVKVVAFDATESAVKLLREGIFTDVIAQKPFDMGYLATMLAVAHAQGYESLPKRISVDSVLISAENIDDPATAHLIYASTVQDPQPPLHDLTVAFVPGVDPDPFFTTMTDGVHTAANLYGVHLVEQAPNHFSPPAQIPVIESLIATTHVDYLITAPTDRDQMIPILRQVYDSGIQVITVDTFIGDGDYAKGSVTFPLSYIGSDNVRGGYIGCSLLAMADILGGGAKIYIQNVRRGISTTDQRADGCWTAAKDFGLDVVQMDYSDNDVAVGKEQTIAVLAEHPDIVGIFGTNVFSAQGAGSAVQEVGLGGVVEVVAFDSTEFAIDLLRKGIVTQVIAQKPGDIGYFAVLSAVAHARGITGIPKRWATGYEVITIDNVDDPRIARFIYREE